jgi:hypothetical protein
MHAHNAGWIAQDLACTECGHVASYGVITDAAPGMQAHYCESCESHFIAAEPTAHNEEMRTYYERIDAETRKAVMASEPTAPNAANAAPLMPACDHCHGTGIWERWGADVDKSPCPFCDGTGRRRGTREGFPAIIRPGHLGADESLPAYAWPGGYPLAYMPGTVIQFGVSPSDDDLINTNAVILCAECATQSLHNPDEWTDEEAMTSVLEDGDLEQDTVCDGCNAVIAYQTYCHECRESVDCDESNPVHLCPATEPYTVWYLPTVPSDEWKAFRYDPEGPEKAKEIAHSLRVQGLAAFTHVQPSRLDFPPVIEEEEEN